MVAEVIHSLSIQEQAIDTEARLSQERERKNMNEASRWRYAQAQKMAPVYCENPKVQLVEIGGSVARGWADRYSDIELGVFWVEAPTEEERRACIERASGVVKEMWPYHPDKQVWSELYSIDGVDFDVSHMTVASMEHLLVDVLEHYNPNILKQYMISAIVHALPLAGAPLLTQWQEKAKLYPDELAWAVIRANLGFNAAWIREVFAARQDLLLLYESYSFAQKRILTLLFGLNRLYHPGFKWIDQRIQALSFTLPELSFRLRQMWSYEPMTGTRLLHALIEEAFTLIDLQMPEVDTRQARAAFRLRPLEWEQAPQKKIPEE
jgi:predicted nucleotidyltransferase